MNNKVWIVNDAGHDFSCAQKFGELIVLTEGLVNIFDVDRIQATLVQKLADFEKDDFLLLTGSTILNVLAVGIIQHKYDFAQVLIYNAKYRKYVPREIHTLKEVKQDLNANKTPENQTSGGNQNFAERFGLWGAKARKNSIFCDSAETPIS